VGNFQHLDRLIVDFGAFTDPAGFETIEIGLVDRNGAGDGERLQTAFDEIPGPEPIVSLVGPDNKYGESDPDGARQRPRPTTSGTASSTPLIERARNRSCSSSHDGFSKLFDPRGTIQRSASA